MDLKTKKIAAGVAIGITLLVGAYVFVQNGAREIAKEVAIVAVKTADKEVKTEVNVTVTDLKIKTKPEIEKAKVATKSFMKTVKAKAAEVKLDKIIVEGKDVEPVESAELKEISLGSCTGCHGDTFGKKALGKSEVVSNMTEAEILISLQDYKSGKTSGGMAGLMKGQVAKYSADELIIISQQITSLPSK